MPDNGGKRLKEEYETIDLLEILRLLKKNLLVILAVTILLAVAGYLVSTFAMLSLIHILVGNLACARL